MRGDGTIPSSTRDRVFAAFIFVDIAVANYWRLGRGVGCLRSGDLSGAEALPGSVLDRPWRCDMGVLVGCAGGPLGYNAGRCGRLSRPKNPASKDLQDPQRFLILNRYRLCRGLPQEKRVNRRNHVRLDS